jgi:hypothetical protein
MIRYLNDATLRGPLAPLPRITELIEIIQFRKWHQLPPISPRYTHPIVPRQAQPHQAATRTRPSPCLHPGSSPCACPDPCY